MFEDIMDDLEFLPLVFNFDICGFDICGFDICGFDIYGTLVARIDRIHRGLPVLSPACTR
jgi:hypothetical protein